MPRSLLLLALAAAVALVPGTRLLLPGNPAAQATVAFPRLFALPTAPSPPPSTRRVLGAPDAAPAARATVDALVAHGSLTPEVAAALREAIDASALPRATLVAFLNDLLGVEPLYPAGGGRAPTFALRRLTGIWVTPYRRDAYDATRVGALVRAFLNVTPDTADRIRRAAAERAAAP